jgi:RNA polymerase sigma factor (sigma-70 family)
MFLKLNQKPDDELVKEYQLKGDKLALGILFKRHSLMCFAVCNKFLKNDEASQDAVMSIFEKLFEDLKKHQIQNFKSWLHSVCRNHCLMILRKSDSKVSKSMIYLDDDASFMELDGMMHQDKGEKEAVLQNLEAAIPKLKDKQRTCIELFYLQEKSYEDICHITGFSNGEVKSHIQNGKRNLKIILEKGEHLLWLIIVWNYLIV